MGVLYRYWLFPHPIGLHSDSINFFFAYSSPQMIFSRTKTLYKLPCIELELSLWGPLHIDSEPQCPFSPVCDGDILWIDANSSIFVILELHLNWGDSRCGIFEEIRITLESLSDYMHKHLIRKQARKNLWQILNWLKGPEREAPSSCRNLECRFKVLPVVVLVRLVKIELILIQGYQNAAELTVLISLGWHA